MESKYIHHLVSVNSISREAKNPKIGAATTSSKFIFKNTDGCAEAPNIIVENVGEYFVFVESIVNPHYRLISVIVNAEIPAIEFNPEKC